MRFAVTPREDMRARWAAHRKNGGGDAPVAEKAPPRPRNVRAVLDLGTITFLSFRGRTYGVPPLPWREGEKILDAWLEVLSYAETLSREDLPSYYAAVDRLVSAMWDNTRPVGRFRRFMKAIGLHRNPFRSATEGDIAELATFFLGRRMTSSESVRPTQAPRSRPT